MYPSKIVGCVCSASALFLAFPTIASARSIVANNGEMFAEYILNGGNNYDVDYVGGPVESIVGLSGNVYWSYRDRANTFVGANQSSAQSNSTVVFGGATDGTIACSSVMTFGVSHNSWVKVTWTGQFAGHLADDPFSSIFGTGNIGASFEEVGLSPILFGIGPSVTIPSTGPFSSGPFVGGVAAISYSVERYFMLDSEKQYEFGSYANLNFVEYDADLLDGDHETWATSNITMELIAPPFVLGDFGGTESSDTSLNSPDGTFDGLDIEGFMLALNDRSAYLTLNPTLADTLDARGDFGGAESLDESFNSPDGSFDSLDLEGFLLALNDPAGYAAIQPTSNLSMIPEPTGLACMALFVPFGFRRRKV